MGQIDQYRSIYCNIYNRGYLLAKAHVVGPPPKKVLNRIIKQGTKVMKMALRDGIEQWEKDFNNACMKRPFLDFKKGLEESVKTKEDREPEI